MKEINEIGSIVRHTFLKVVTQINVYLQLSKINPMYQ